jgi:pilus assembly protein FimV
MSSGKNPLVLMMALSVPGAAHAIGLGDIHIDSALNERLAAEIDIVGASALELTDLRAAVASGETFLRYGVERPAFLSSATFKVSQDSLGRPVLAVRSTESFNEPVVNFLVDLHWRNGELVRQYTLLLDPAGFNSAPIAAATPVAQSARAAPAIAAAPASAPAPTTIAAAQADTPTAQPAPAGAESAARKTTHIKVGARATLRGIAWRVGERSQSDLQRMMIAIFRANPSAFDGNINRLHLGAVLTIPSHAELAAIPAADAKREVRAQMAEWRASPRSSAAFAVARAAAAPGSIRPASLAPAPLTATLAAAVPIAPVPIAPTTDASASVPAETDALNSRVRSLEQELVEVQGLLASQRDKLAGMQQEVQLVENTAPRAAAPDAAEALPAAKSANTSFLPIAAGIGLLAAALAALYFRLRRRAPNPNALRIGTGAALAGDAFGSMQDATVAARQERARDEAARTQAPLEVRSAADDGPNVDGVEDDSADTQEAPAPIFEEDTQPLIPVMAAGSMPKRVNNAAATISRPEPEGNTVNMRADTVSIPAPGIERTRIEATRLDYNLVDLDMTAQHVQMPSVLNENVVVKERRTNLADALKLAIEREPDRHDLRMKLLELYYAAAATNRQAFLEVVQKFARDRDHLQSDQWDKIAFMGRQIAAENALFAEATADDDDLADCA